MAITIMQTDTWRSDWIYTVYIQTVVHPLNDRNFLIVNDWALFLALGLVRFPRRAQIDESDKDVWAHFSAPFLTWLFGFILSSQPVPF